jgi:hypothetical protein
VTFFTVTPGADVTRRIGRRRARSNVMSMLLAPLPLFVRSVVWHRAVPPLIRTARWSPTATSAIVCAAPEMLPTETLTRADVVVGAGDATTVITVRMRASSPPNRMFSVDASQ